MSIAQSLYIGLDAGGSSTDLMARVLPDGFTFTRSGRPANLQREGVDGSAEVMVSLINEAVAAYPEATVQAVCAGVAGAGRPADQQVLAETIRNLLPDLNPDCIHIVHDAVIALEAAFGGAPGIIVIVGTGSIAFAKTEAGEQLRAGGWGYLLGDEGSGNALGVHGLRAVAAMLDGGPPTILQHLLAEQYGIATPDDLIRNVYREQWPVQRMAPLVVEAAVAGDAIAQHIIKQQTHVLARQVGWLAERAAFTTPRIAVLGGLSKETFYASALGEALAFVLPDCHLHAPLHTPVVGALRMAMDL